MVLGCPWDIPRMSDKMENHWFLKRVYSTAMASNVLRLYQRHFKANPEMFTEDGSPAAHLVPLLNDLGKRRPKLKDVDEHMVSQIGGPRNIGLWPFADASAYYSWASPERLIEDVRT